MRLIRLRTRFVMFNVALILLLTLNGCIDPDITAPVANDCRDLTGMWSSGDYEALVVEGDGSHDRLPNLSMTLDIEHQIGCTFRATNTWANGTIGGSEHVAGVLHRDSDLITMIEVGGHPLGGSTARVLGRLVSDDQMEWEYAGWSNNGDRGIVFSTIIHRESAPQQREVCPDLTGSWVSGNYEALVVNADGTHDTLENLSMSLDIEHQDNCAFRAKNVWTNGTIGGTEHIAGVLHADGGLITMIEVGGHPLGGSNARVFGRLVDDRIEWEYAGWSDNANRAVVFSTIVHRAGTPDQREVCPDLTGTWTSGEYHAMSVKDDGSDEVFSGLTMSLIIHHQQGCAFRGENIWSNDTLSGREQVAGVLHSDGDLITMLEVGEHPFSGATARVFAQLVNGNQMSWEYAGWSADGTRGNVFSTLLTKN